jgi:hypothetical protein
MLIVGALPISGLTTNAARDTIYPASPKYNRLVLAAAPPSAPVATLYTNGYRGGKNMIISMNAPALPIGINKLVSCIEVPLGSVATLYSLPNYGGLSRRFVGPTYIGDLGWANFNDMAQSVKVEPALGVPFLTVNDTYNTGGVYASLGELAVSDLRNIGFPLNALSSLEIKTTCTVTLYAGINYGGATKVLLGPMIKTNVTTFNDKTQSIKVSI